MAKDMYCTSCGTVTIPKTYTKGSFVIEIVLWLCFLVPENIQGQVYFLDIGFLK